MTHDLRHRHRRRRHGGRQPRRRAGAAGLERRARRSRCARFGGAAELRRAHHGLVERQPPDPGDLGVWPAVEAQATPIRKIHVSDQGRFGFARIDAAEQGLAAMGYVVPNRALGRRAVVAPSRERRTSTSSVPAQVSRVAPDEDIGRAARSPRRARADAAIETKLVVAADGAQSAVRSAFGVDGGVPRLRANRRDHHRAAAALPRPCGLRAVHGQRAAGAVAARRRPLHAGVDA